MTSRSGLSPTWDERALTDLYRSQWGRLLSVLVARTRRLDLAEDALSEAFARAAARWPHDGVPGNPTAWLYTTAWRQIVGRVRTEAVAGRKAPLLAVRPGWVAPAGAGRFDEVGELDELEDERLQLILLCCHPALHPDARSALALRLVIGTPTDEIARLFLVPLPTMAARITRAKKKIVLAGIPLGAPVADELRARLEEVCRTIYLAFTAGYAPGTGAEPLRADLAGAAVELAAVLVRLVPDAPQARALLSLLLLQHARRDARFEHGRLVTLSEQDRARWHHGELRAGLALVAGITPTEGYTEELRLQALIAAEHARAPTAAATDWNAIAGHYRHLEARTRSPIVRLNRAVALAEADGPDAGLALLDGLDGALAGNHRLAAVRADLARRAGQFDLARTCYARAIELCTNDAERDHLAHRRAGLDPPATGSP